MNYVQLVDRLRQECGVSGSTITTTVGQAGEYARLVTWINQAWLDVQMARHDWGWMRKTATFQTADHAPTYSLATIGINDFAYWAQNTFRNYSNPQVTMTAGSPGVITLAGHNLSVGDTVTLFTSGSLYTGLTAGTAIYVKTIVDANNFTVSATNGGAAINFTGSQSGTQTITSNNTTVFAGMKTEIFMSPMDYEAWRDTYLYGALRTVTTRPIAIAVAPDKSLCLGPVSAAGYTVLGDYYSTPSSMSADTDTPAMPTQYHMAIVYKAMQSYGMYEGAQEVVARGQQEYDRIMRHLVTSRTPMVMQGGPLA